MFQSFQDALTAGDFDALVNTSLGQIIIFVLAAGLLILAVSLSNSKEGLSVKALTYSAIAIAIGFVLSNFKILQLPYGGSVTPFSMLPILAIGYFFGIRTGVLAGVVFGLVQMALAPAGYIVSPAQALLDYPLAYGALGLSGIFMNHNNGLVKGVLLGSFSRFIFHFISGVIFFAMYAPENLNPVLYSAGYNISYTGIEGIVTAIVVAIPAVSGVINQVKKNLLA